MNERKSEEGKLWREKDSYKKKRVVKKVMIMGGARWQ